MKTPTGEQRGNADKGKRNKSEVAAKLDCNDRITWYVIEAESQESIHNHNAYARVEKNKSSTG